MKILEVEQKADWFFPVSKSYWEEQAKSHGYSPQTSRDGKIIYVFSKNGIKTEIKIFGAGANKKWGFVTGFGLSNDNIEALRSELAEQKWPIVGATPDDPLSGINGSSEKKKYLILQGSGIDEKSILDNFFKLVKNVEDIEAIKNIQIARGLSKLVPPSDFRYYYGVAYQLYIATRAGLPHMLPRGGKDGSSPGSFDVRDSLITTGITPEGKEQLKNKGRAYREHVVPSDLIMRKGIEIAKDRTLSRKEALRAIVKLIKNNLAIVLISDDQAKLLDNELKLKTKMPAGWNWGDDIYARLNTAGFTVLPLREQ